MNNRNIVGKKVKYLRNNLKISQEDLAARLNVLGINIDRTMISKIENNSREVTDYEVNAIAQALRVPINELFED